MTQPQNVLGIDLGTYSSCMAIFQDSRDNISSSPSNHTSPEPVIIPTTSGSQTHPSFISMLTDADGINNRQMCEISKDNSISNFQSTIFHFKRILGLNLYHPSVIDFKNTCIPTIQNYGPHNTPHFQFPGTPPTYISPFDATVEMLKHLIQQASAFSKIPISHVVVTVPTCFNFIQKQLIKNACISASVVPARILTDTTAAAMSWYHSSYQTLDEENRIVVVDIGTGNFSVSAMTTEEGIIEIISSGGDFFGGRDFVSSLVKYILDTLFQRDGVSMTLKSHPHKFAKLFQDAEKAMIKLSTSSTANICIENIIPSDYTSSDHTDFSLIISRSTFEDLLSPFTHNMIDIIRDVIVSSQWTNNTINYLLITGGCSNIPLIRKILTKYFDEPQCDLIHLPKNTVAIGAAIQGCILSSKPMFQDYLLIDATSSSLGIESPGGIMSVIIKKNTSIPCRKTLKMTTYSDNQSQVTCKIFEGERKRSIENIALGSLVLKVNQDPPKLKGVPKLNISFDIDSNGIISVSAVDEDAPEHIEKLKISHASTTRSHLWNKPLHLTYIPPKITPTNYISFDLGIQIAEEKMHVLIPRNSTLPIQNTFTFSTFQDNQTTVVVSYYKGNNFKTVDNTFLDTLTLQISPRPKGKPIISVEFHVTENGKLTVTARDIDPNGYQTIVRSSVQLEINNETQTQSSAEASNSNHYTNHPEKLEEEKT